MVFTKLSEVSKEAFYYAKDIVIEGKVEKISEGAFGSCELKSIPDLSKCTSIGARAFSHATIRNDYDTKNKQLIINCDIGDAWKGNFSLIGVFEEMKLARGITVRFDNGCTKIGSRAFYGAELNVTSIELNDSIKEIGSEAFSIQDLSEITLGDSIVSIAEDAFIKTKVTIYANSGSYAAFWASENGYTYKPVGGDDLSWLFD